MLVTRLRQFFRPSRIASLLRSPALLMLGTSVAFTLFVGYRYAHGTESLDSFKFGRDAQQGKKIAPVPLNLQGKNPELVYLGSYLVNAQLGCNDCHTCPSYKGTNPFTVGGPGLLGNAKGQPINAANYLAGGTPVTGRGASLTSTYTAPNLTPDASGKPGGMTFADFKDAMQNGHTSRKPGHILQVMPWPIYRNLYENDLYAIYQFLSAIPTGKPGVCAKTQDTGK